MLLLFQNLAVTPPVIIPPVITETSISGRTIVDEALIALGVYGPGETPSEIHRDHGLVVLNRYIARFNLTRRNIYVYNDDAYPFTISAQFYTIGATGADFIAKRPIEILKANLVRTRSTPNERVRLEVINVSEYADIRLPVESGAEPVALYYQPTFPLGRLWPWPYPANTTAATGNKLELFTRSLFSRFVNLDTTVELPYGYEAAWIYTLAELLAVPFGKAIPPELAEQARLSRAAIQSVNVSPPQLATRQPGMPGAYWDEVLR